MNPNDTTTTDKCPHCGDRDRIHHVHQLEFGCGTYLNITGEYWIQSRLCHEREERQKAEAEVERLRSNLRRAIQLAREVAYHDAPEMWAELEEIEETLNPETK
jgi:predicted choloylglycine hydrolase